MINQSQVQPSGQSEDDAVGNSPEVRRELTESIGSLPGWYKGVCRKKTQTRQKIVRVAAKLAESWEGLENFAEGIGKIARNMPGDHRRRTRYKEYRKLSDSGSKIVKLGGHVWL
ncbi:hypothetical protein BHM03_00038008 [Ensete ventricosum]|nr:hypothetical protein BHM03_00038008 [Ensete ventricosum]